MNGRVDYCYARGELLDHPHTYFYSAFHGEDFITAWRADRDACLQKLEQQPVVDTVDCSSATAQLLERMNESLRASGLTDADQSNLDLLLRNFEAKKRIYEDYAPGFTSKDRNDYLALCLYVRFAEVLALAYRRGQELPYLNALLKCVDIICATGSGLDASDRKRVAAVLSAEREFVADLAHRLGVAP